MTTKARGNTRVLIARKVRNLTQGDLAKRVGIDANYIVDIERHGWIPPAPTRTRLAKELRSTVDALFGEDLKASA